MPTIDPRCIVEKRKFLYRQTECPNAGARSAINEYKTSHEAYLANGLGCGLCGLGFNNTNGDVKTE